MLADLRMIWRCASWILFSAVSSANAHYHNPIKPEHREVLDLISSQTKSFAQQEFFQKSLAIFDQLGHQNYTEIHLLLEEIRKHNSGVEYLSQVNQDVIARVLLKIKEDQSLFLQIHEQAISNSTYRYSCLGLAKNSLRFCGSSDTHGVLNEASKLLKQCKVNVITGKVDDKDPMGVQITVLKTLLLYICLEMSPLEKDDLFKKLSIMYPAKISADEKIGSQIKSHNFYIESEEYGQCIMLPNAGYVFASKLRNNKFCGLDCAKFVCYITGSTELSTENFESLWKAKMNQLRNTNDQGRWTDFMKSNRRTACEEFDAISADNNFGSLELADIVVWRGPTKSISTEGHAVLFFDWVNKDNGRFLGMELSCNTYRNKEGLYIKEFCIHKANKETYVLRRRSK